MLLLIMHAVYVHAKTGIHNDKDFHKWFTALIYQVFVFKAEQLLSFHLYSFTLDT